MKKYIMSFLAALFTLTGCYDLDRAPYDQLSSSTFWPMSQPDMTSMKPFSWEPVPRVPDS